MRTLLVDNHDSYTFNLYQLLAQVNGGTSPPPPPRKGKGPGQPDVTDTSHACFARHNLTFRSQITCTGHAVAPTVVQNDDSNGARIMRDVSSGAYDSIVISPGPGTPHRATDVGERHMRVANFGTPSACGLSIV